MGVAALPKRKNHVEGADARITAPCPASSDIRPATTPGWPNVKLVDGVNHMAIVSDPFYSIAGLWFGYAFMRSALASPR